MPRRILDLAHGTEFLVSRGAQSGALSLNPDTGVPARVLLSDCTGHCGSMLLEPDPARAAVLKERVRAEALAKRVVEDRLSRRGLAGQTWDTIKYDLTEAFAAIDAPSETVSEFQQGAEAMRTEALGKLDRLSEAADSDVHRDEAEQRREAYRCAKNLIKSIVLTEPTP